jgi:hypothetical protein
MSNLMRAFLTQLALFGAATQSAFAFCPSGDFIGVPEEFKAADFVILGHRTSEQYSAEGAGAPWVDGTFYSVRVTKVLKGPAIKRARVFSENSSGRFPLLGGRDYLLFISKCDGVDYVYAKGNSGPMASSRTTLAKLDQLLATKK